MPAADFGARPKKQKTRKSGSGQVDRKLAAEQELVKQA